MNREEAMERIEAIEREAAELRKIVETKPKKEPRGLCWVSDTNKHPGPNDNVDLIVGTDDDHWYRNHRRTKGTRWSHAVPLTAAEMEQYRGRWE